MLRLIIVTIVLLAATTHTPGALAQEVATSPATPSPGLNLGIDFLTEDQVPSGLVIIMDGERTLDDVVANFTDPAAATKQFEEWGWQGNVVRGFHVPNGTKHDPAEIDGIYISIHAFGNSRAALDALDYAFAIHIAGTDLEELGTDALGDYSRAIYGEVGYGNEITYYVQSGNLLIRFSASSPEGDPRSEAEALLRTMLQTLKPTA